MLRVALIRPGATDFDEQHRLQGDLDLPLSRRGEQEVKQIASQLEDLPLKAVYCGNGEPCSSVAASIGKACGCKIKLINKLRNANLGLWQGLKEEEIRRKHPRVYKQWHESPDSICPPNGESLPEVLQRARSALEAILKKHRKGEIIGIVVSEPMATLVRCCLLKKKLGKLPEAAGENGRWEIIEVKPD